MSSHLLSKVSLQPTPHLRDEALPVNILTDNPAAHFDFTPQTPKKIENFLGAKNHLRTITHTHKATFLLLECNTATDLCHW